MHLPSRRWRLFLISLCVAAIGGAGCAGQGGNPEKSVLDDAARVAGGQALIHFETHGGPTDVAGDIGPRLTRADAVRLALANDPDLQVALAKVRAAEADARQERLLPNPVLSVIVRFREGGGDPIITADLTADLLSLLHKPDRERAAERRLRAAAADALTAVLDLVEQTEETYVAAQSLEAQVAVLAARRELLDRLLAMAKARVEAGEGTRLDVTTAQGRRLDLEEQVADRQLRRTVKRLALARLVGRPSGPTDWELDRWEPPPTSSGAGPETAWVSAALANRPEVRARRWELAAAGDDAALAAWDPFKGSDVGAEAERDVDWSAGPSITTPLPLFDWGQASRAKARAAQVQARHELTKERRRVVEETRAAYATLVNSQAALARVRAELVPLQDRQRQQAEDLYRAGESDLTALLVAEENVQDAREKAVLLQETADTAMIKLRRAVGGRAVVDDLSRDTEAGRAPAPPPGTTP